MENAVFYRPAMNGYAEVARITAGQVRIMDAASLPLLSKADLVSLVSALAGATTR